MLNQIELLDSICKNTEMGIEGIQSIMKKTESAEFRAALQTQLNEYKAIRQEAVTQLSAVGAAPEKVPESAKISARLTVQMKTAMNDSVSHIAEMMIKGSTNGITKLISQRNDYKGKDIASVDLANRLITAEQNNIEALKAFL